jgi:hypothetical protein
MEVQIIKRIQSAGKLYIVLALDGGLARTLGHLIPHFTSDGWKLYSETNLKNIKRMLHSRRELKPCGRTQQPVFKIYNYF